MKYKVIDEFLEKEDFEKVEDLLMSSSIDWHHVKDDDSVDGGYLVHPFFYYDVNKRPISSPFFDSLAPLLKKLSLKALVRVKANFFHSTERIESHGLHHHSSSHKMAIFSVNTNNGYTRLEDGRKINSVANRVLMFDPINLHASSSCSDKSCRINVVIDYV